MSNEAKFTPGPWIIDDYGDVTANGEDVARMPNMVPEDEYNAALIAAAPDLYAALSDCLRFLDSHAAHLSCSREIENAADAIAKARGES